MILIFRGSKFWKAVKLRKLIDERAQISIPKMSVKN